MKNFKNQKVVVTGGSSGIGRAIALAFAQLGADVVITYRSKAEAAAQVVTELQSHSVQAKALQVDLAIAADRNRLAHECQSFLGDIDVLVNNAGTATRKSFLEISQDEITQVIEVNLLAPFFVMQNFARVMVAQQEKNPTPKDYAIINITSISREVVTPGLSHYEASKAGLSQLTKSAAIDLAKHHIRVNDVAPGLVPTDINRTQWEANSELWQNRIAGIPLGRAGNPDEIAEAVLFLASNRWVTGTTINVDGGRARNWYA